MAQYLSPGVYVEEIPSMSRPIAGVGTSVPGFVGIIPDSIFIPARLNGDEKGFRHIEFDLKEVGRAKSNETYRITSWSDYIKLFGNFLLDDIIPPTVEKIEEGSGANKKIFVAGKTTPHLSLEIKLSSNDVKIVKSNKDGKYKQELATEQDFSKVVVKISDDSTDAIINMNQQQLAHAVYGFFNNGGTSCYVARITEQTKLTDALAAFELVDEITMVVTPGMADDVSYAAVIAHCEKMKDRVAILDPLDQVNEGFDKLKRPQNSTYAAFYFPWLQVFDPATALTKPDSNGLIYIPPSGHIAGVYARTDAARGVFKAPANEAIQGVTGVKYLLNKADQDGLNPVGVNLIRPLVGAIRVWGARTVGGDANGEFRYISTRRYFNFLRESIEEGTQFVVFEPNTSMLWERIKRTVGDFLLNQWRAGALFGSKAEQAFYVKCDAETNPASVREAGMVVTEIGVAIVKPAEFVVFRMQQLSGN